MTISVWRYSHLALAVSSFLFIALAAITGVILSVEAVNDKLPPYQVNGFDTLRLSQVIPVITESYSEVSEISVDERKFVTIKAFDESGEKVHAYIDPRSGKVLGAPREQSDFFQWVTALHRSLFLHELGRFFIGLTSFLLLLITITGSILVIQRQHGLLRFFSKIAKEYFAQYYHVVLGRLMLIPIFILAITGTYLSLVRFEVFPEKKLVHPIGEQPEEIPEKMAADRFPAFQQTLLSELRSVEFPFADDDPEEFYTIKLKDRELVVNQFDGSVVSEVSYPFTKILTSLSLNLHTGRSSVVWAIILAIASLNILFFIYSGFVITLRRRRGRIKNRYKPQEAKFVILAGSENGSTLYFAAAIHQQLLDAGKISFLGELNHFQRFPNAEHLIIFSSTYGLGDPPANASRFRKLVKEISQEQPIKVSVLGFGSDAYPDFCAYARELDGLLRNCSWAEPFLDFHTVDDKSPEQFVNWVNQWNATTGMTLANTPALYNQHPGSLHKMIVLEKTPVNEKEQTFLLTLRSPSGKFTSGDLLGIHPANDHRERLYSIGKVDHNIQLLVKYYPGGLGSAYLLALRPGEVLKAKLISNPSFHIPKKSNRVVMVSNGTGIAPFLGMISQNSRRKEIHLYCGFRKKTDMTARYDSFIEAMKQKRQLNSVHFAFSRQENFSYVMDLIKRDAYFFADVLKTGGTIMLCGSLAMQRDVEIVLNTITLERNGMSLEYYKQNGQLLADCY